MPLRGLACIGTTREEGRDQANDDDSSAGRAAIHELPPRLQYSTSDLRRNYLVSNAAGHLLTLVTRSTLAVVFQFALHRDRWRTEALE
jgi:hypothetical protein